MSDDYNALYWGPIDLDAVIDPGVDTWYVTSEGVGSCDLKVTRYGAPQQRVQVEVPRQTTTCASFDKILAEEFAESVPIASPPLRVEDVVKLQDRLSEETPMEASAWTAALGNIGLPGTERESDKASMRAFVALRTRVSERLGINEDDGCDLAAEAESHLHHVELTPDNAQQVEDLCVEFVERLRAIGANE